MPFSMFSAPAVRGDYCRTISRPGRRSIVKRSDDAEGFVVLPRRWVVESTFGWLYRFRRLSKDYEVLPETSEARIYAAMVRVMLQRLARNAAVYL